MPAAINANRVADAMQSVDMRLRSAGLLHEDAEELIAGMLRAKDDVSAESLAYTARQLECLSFMVGEMLISARGEVAPLLAEAGVNPAA